MEFTRRLLERFERKDTELHFQELAHLRQTGNAEVYIKEFQRLAMMVTDISEARLIMLFVEGLTEPLYGWVRAYKCTSLHDAISRTRDMIDAVPKNQAFVPARPTAHQGTEMRGHHREMEDVASWMMTPRGTSGGGGCASRARSLGHQGTSAPRAKPMSSRCSQIVNLRRRRLRQERSREMRGDHHQEGQHHHHLEEGRLPQLGESSLHFGVCRSI